MMKKIIPTLLLAGLSHAAFAAEQPFTVISANCLLKDKTNISVLSQNKTASLINTNQAGLSQLIKAKETTKTACGGFMDVSDAWNTQHLKTNPDQFLTNYSLQSNNIASETYEIKHPKQVAALYEILNPNLMWQNLAALTAFDNRYANSNEGVKAANWIKDTVLSMAKEYGRTDVSARFIATGSRYKQPSLVVKLGTSDKAGIVIGGHMDTLNSDWSNKPGADDDGSGSVTVLETARSIFASGMTFDRPIYFIWYAAEEMGLVGSQYVVKDFKQAHIPVKAVMQMDMTGYAYQNEKTMWLGSDYVNTSLTTFMENLIKTYINKEVKYTRCGYACSDHASWTAGGFASAMPFESSFEDHNPYIHSSSDTMDHLSLDHMTDYAKLALAFVAELGDPIA